MLLVNVFILSGAWADDSQRWIDSIYNALSPEQRLGQLIFLKETQNQKVAYDYLNLFASNHFGGIEINYNHQSVLDTLKKHYSFPLLISAGAGYNIPKKRLMPSIFTMGAIDQIKLIEQAAVYRGERFSLAGIQMNADPLFELVYSIQDLNASYSRLGNSGELALEKISYLKAGMDVQGIISTARLKFDFSEYPDLNRLGPEIRSIRKKSEENIFNESLSHINNPYLSLRLENIPVNDLKEAAALQTKIVQQHFRNLLNFNGLLIADITEVVENEIGPAIRNEEELEKLLFASGVDVIITDKPERTLSGLIDLRDAKILRAQEIERRVKRVLWMKYITGSSPDETDQDLPEEEPMPDQSVTVLQYLLYKNAITLMENNQGLIPFRTLDTVNFASLSIGAATLTGFQETLDSYAPFVHFVLGGKDTGRESYNELAGKLKFFDHVIVGVHRKMSKDDLEFLKHLQSYCNVIPVLFDVSDETDIPSGFYNLLVAYENNAIAQNIAAQMLFGALEAKGLFPVAQRNGSRPGIQTKSLYRLSYMPPELQQMDSETLMKIDKLVEDGIQNKVFPGCQVLVARNGSVVFEKSYGNYTYESHIPITNRSVYDIASITKVAATTQAIMFLTEHGLINVNEKISKYLPELVNTNKEHIILKDILAHQAGLRPGLPYWNQLIDRYNEYDEVNVSISLDESEKLNPGAYSGIHLKDSLWQWTIRSPLVRRTSKFGPYPYKYSDLGFYMLQVLAERMLNQPIDEFMSQNFYEPMGMSTMGYNPLCKLPLNRIVPTEIDYKYRGGLVWGKVHDPTAAMKGGVAGHAGLFSNATDLAKFGQMQLNKGIYGDRIFLSPETVELFTTSIGTNNRRSLGWDKPDTNEKNNPASKYASAESFGHRGFTGTAIWIDPVYNLVYIFLSNRVYPTARNNKLNDLKFRQKIQDIVYEAIRDYDTSQVSGKF
ncbi:MAG: serine hydrolase [Cyclobacteriaceae bacterium]|nr:serine hydrolase [Cyclobacteriaceae bacterium]